jgi:hypothetical protein
VINNADILSTLVGGHVMPGYLRVEKIAGDTGRSLDRPCFFVYDRIQAELLRFKAL